MLTDRFIQGILSSIENFRELKKSLAGLLRERKDRLKNRSMAFSDTPRTDAHDNVGTAAAVSEGMNPPSLSELPFLVTHWLANYQGEEGDPQREEVIERLRNATSEMAAAFSDLGAYGTSSRVSAALYTFCTFTIA